MITLLSCIFGLMFYQAVILTMIAWNTEKILREVQE